MKKGDYLGVPIIKEENDFFTNDKSFWYLVGYYLGDGWLGKNSYEIKFIYLDFSQSLWNEGSFMATVMLILVGLTMLISSKLGRGEVERRGALW